MQNNVNIGYLIGIKKKLRVYINLPTPNTSKTERRIIHIHGFSISIYPAYSNLPRLHFQMFTWVI